MTFKKVLLFLWNNYAEIIAAGTSTIDFISFVALSIEKLLSKTPNNDITEVTDEMMEELKQSWAGPLPPPGEIFPQS